MENLSSNKPAATQTYGSTSKQISWDNLLGEAKTRKETTWDDVAKESKFNPGKKPDDTTTESKPQAMASLEDVQDLLDTPAEKLQDGAEKIEKRLRKKLQEAYEYSTKREFDSLGYVSEALEGAGFVDISHRVEDYNEAAAKIDRSLADGIVSYIDAKFSNDPKKSKEHNDIWDEYQRKTKGRATTLESTLNIVRSSIFYSGDDRLEGAVEQVSEMKSDIPEGQMRLLRAYKTYFDDPTKKNLKNLDDRLGEYIGSVRGNLDRLTDNIALAVPNSDDLCYAVGVDLSRTVAQGREDVHGAIIEYFKFKHDSFKGSTTETIPDTQPVAKNLNNPTLKNSKMLSLEELRGLII